MECDDKAKKIRGLLSSFVVSYDQNQKEGSIGDCSYGAASQARISRDKEAFLNRLKTYSPFNWFAKPNWLSPPVCARFGWQNVDKDTLQCVSCKAFFCGKMPSSYQPIVYNECCKKLKESLVSSHHLFCPWFNNPSPESYLSVTIPKISQLQSALESLVSLNKNLPKIEEDILDKLVVSVASLHALQQQLGLTDLCDITVFTSAAVLLFCGWQAKGCKSQVVCCLYCSRECGLWNYRSLDPMADSDHSDDDVFALFSPLKKRVLNVHTGNKETQGDAVSTENLEVEMQCVENIENVGECDGNVEKSVSTGSNAEQTDSRECGDECSPSRIGKEKDDLNSGENHTVGIVTMPESSPGSPQQNSTSEKTKDSISEYASGGATMDLIAEDAEHLMETTETSSITDNSMEVKDCGPALCGESGVLEQSEDISCLLGTLEKKGSKIDDISLALLAKVESGSDIEKSTKIESIQESTADDLKTALNFNVDENEPIESEDRAKETTEELSNEVQSSPLQTENEASYTVVCDVYPAESAAEQCSSASSDDNPHSDPNQSTGLLFPSTSSVEEDCAAVNTSPEVPRRSQSDSEVGAGHFLPGDDSFVEVIDESDSEIEEPQESEEEEEDISSETVSSSDQAEVDGDDDSSESDEYDDSESLTDHNSSKDTAWKGNDDLENKSDHESEIVILSDTESEGDKFEEAESSSLEGESSPLRRYAIEGTTVEGESSPLDRYTIEGSMVKGESSLLDGRAMEGSTMEGEISPLDGRAMEGEISPLDKEAMEDGDTSALDGQTMAFTPLEEIFSPSSELSEVGVNVNVLNSSDKSEEGSELWDLQEQVMSEVVSDNYRSGEGGFINTQPASESSPRKLSATEPPLSNTALNQREPLSHTPLHQREPLSHTPLNQTEHTGEINTYEEYKDTDIDTESTTLTYRTNPPVIEVVFNNGHGDAPEKPAVVDSIIPTDTKEVMTNGISENTLLSEVKTDTSLNGFGIQGEVIDGGEICEGVQGTGDGNLKHEANKKRKKTCKKTTFNPFTEHRPWCPWIQHHSDAGNHSDNPLTAHPGWKLMVATFVPEEESQRKEEDLAKLVKTSPPFESLKRIRKMFYGWASPNVT